MTSDDIKTAIAELRADHTRMRQSVGGLTGPDGQLAYGCTMCDNLWPCPTIRLVLAYEALSDQFQNFIDKMRWVADTNHAARKVWEVWYSWMQLQDRVVRPRQESWEILPGRDKKIDRHIAIELAQWLIDSALHFEDFGKATPYPEDNEKADQEGSATP